MTTATQARYATVHWLEFDGVRLPADLALGAGADPLELARVG